MISSKVESKLIRNSEIRDAERIARGIKGVGDVNDELLVGSIRQ